MSKTQGDPVTIKRLRETAAVLKDKGSIITLRDLRHFIGKDLEKGITQVAEETGASKPLLLALLIAEAKDDAGKKGKHKLLPYWCSLKTFPAVLTLSKSEIAELWKTKGLLAARDPLVTVLRQSVARPRRLMSNWRKHWLDAVAVLVPIILALLVLRANDFNKQRVPYLTASANIPAFVKISNQVESKSGPGKAGDLTSIDDVRGQYTLSPIRSGANLAGKQLLPAELSAKMQARQILSLPIKTGGHSLSLIPPAEAVMVLSPREGDAKAVAAAVFHVIVLSLENQGDVRSATVAMNSDDFHKAAGLLGSHEVFLSQIPK